MFQIGMTSVGFAWALGSLMVLLGTTVTDMTRTSPKWRGRTNKSTGKIWKDTSSTATDI